jgi:hypothetical protein
MKLNMMVVMTMCEPRLACRIAGISAHSAPTAAAPRIASGKLIHQGKTLSNDRQTIATPRPEI